MRNHIQRRGGTLVALFGLTMSSAVGQAQQRPPPPPAERSSSSDVSSPDGGSRSQQRAKVIDQATPPDLVAKPGADSRSSR